jgi:hypothetical protein
LDDCPTLAKIGHVAPRDPSSVAVPSRLAPIFLTVDEPIFD